MLRNFFLLASLECNAAVCGCVQRSEFEKATGLKGIPEIFPGVGRLGFVRTLFKTSSPEFNQSGTGPGF